MKEIIKCDMCGAKVNKIVIGESKLECRDDHDRMYAQCTNKLLACTKCVYAKRGK